MALMNIIYARSEEVATECYVVVAALGDGKVMYHEGPVRYPYFSKDQAEGLVAELNTYKRIDTTYWHDGSFCDMTVRDIEDGFYTGNH